MRRIEQTEQPEQMTETDFAPRPFWEVPRLWLNFWKMDEEFFQNEKSHVSHTNTFMGVLLYAAIFTGLAVLYALIFRWIYPIKYESYLGNVASPDSIFIRTYGINFIKIPIVFYINNILVFIVGKIFRGKAKFSTQAYFDALVKPPLTIISMFLSFTLLIPEIGVVIRVLPAFILSIYSIILTLRAYRIAHEISSMRVFTIFLGLTIVWFVITATITMHNNPGVSLMDVFSSYSLLPKSLKY